jgi:MFS family permease
VPASPSRRALVWTLVLFAIANLVNYADRNVLFPNHDTLRERFAFSERELGFLGMIYMAGHALATIPFGWFGDRYDRRRVVAYGLLAASVACALGVVATGIVTLSLSRLVVGIGTAAVVPIANSLLGELFEGPHKASRLAVFNLGLFFGGVVGFGGGAALGFPFALWVLAVIGVATAIAIRVLPVPARRPASAARLTFAGFVRQSRELLSIRTMRWLMASTTAMAFASGGYLAWFVDFLKDDKKMSEGEAQILLGIGMVGGLCGVIAGGRVADRLRRRIAAGRLWTIVLGMASTVPCAVACIYLPLGVPMYAFSVLTLFFISWYHAPMAASVDDLATDDRAATSQALVIFLMHLFGTAPAKFLVGALKQEVGLQTAMLLPTAMVAVAAVLMVIALRSFASDSARVARVL